MLAPPPKIIHSTFFLHIYSICHQKVYSNTQNFTVQLGQGISLLINMCIKTHEFITWAREAHSSIGFVFKNLHFLPELGNISFHYNFYSKTLISQLGQGITFFITISIQKPSFLSWAGESHFSLQFLFKNLHFQAGLGNHVFH